MQLHEVERKRKLVLEFVKTERNESIYENTCQNFSPRFFARPNARTKEKREKIFGEKRGYDMRAMFHRVEEFKAFKGRE